MAARGMTLANQTSGPITTHAALCTTVIQRRGQYQKTLFPSLTINVVHIVLHLPRGLVVR